MSTIVILSNTEIEQRAMRAANAARAEAQQQGLTAGCAECAAARAYDLTEATLLRERRDVLNGGVR